MKQRIASLVAATVLVAATAGTSLVVGATSARALGPNAIRAGFNTTVFGPNDDGTYPCIGSTPGDPTGSCANPAAAISLPFSLDFFGTPYSSVFLNNNGNLTFDSPLAAFTPANLMNSGHAMIAPYFADVDTRAGTTARFGTGTVSGHSAWGATWPGVACFNKNTSVLNNFQVVLIDRSDIAANDFDLEFNYDRIKWDTGQANGGGSACVQGNNASARVGYSDGMSSSNSYELPGSGANNAFLDANASTGLISHSRNSTQKGRYLFSFRNGSPLRTLNVVKTGTGTGTVTSTPAGINCGTDCSQEYAANTVVALHATAASGSVFGGWSGGGCPPAAANCNVAVNGQVDVTAIFNLATSNAACSGLTGTINSVLTNNGVAGPGLLLVKKNPQQLALSATNQTCMGGYVTAARTKMKVTTATAVNCQTLPKTTTQVGVTLGGSGTFTWTAPLGMGTSNFNIQWYWSSNTSVHFYGSVSASESQNNLFKNRHVTGDLTTFQSLKSVASGGDCSATIPLKHFDLTSINYTVK